MGSDYIAEKELTLPGPPELGFTMLHISAGVLGFTRARGSEPAPTSVQSSLEPHHGAPVLLQRGEEARERFKPGPQLRAPLSLGRQPGFLGHRLTTKAGSIQGQLWGCEPGPGQDLPVSPLCPQLPLPRPDSSLVYAASHSQEASPRARLGLSVSTLGSRLPMLSTQSHGRASSHARVMGRDC